MSINENSYITLFSTSDSSKLRLSYVSTESTNTFAGYKTLKLPKLGVPQSMKANILPLNVGGLLLGWYKETLVPAGSAKVEGLLAI